MLKKLLRHGGDADGLRGRPWLAVAFSLDDPETARRIRAFCEGLAENPDEPVERIGPGDEGLVSLWGPVDAPMPSGYAETLLLRIVGQVCPVLRKQESVCVSCEGDDGSVIQTLAIGDPDQEGRMQLERIVLHDGEILERAPIAGHRDHPTNA